MKLVFQNLLLESWVLRNLCHDSLTVGPWMNSISIVWSVAKCAYPQFYWIRTSRSGAAFLTSSSWNCFNSKVENLVLEELDCFSYSKGLNTGKASPNSVSWAQQPNMLKRSEYGFDELPGWQIFHLKDLMVDTLYLSNQGAPHTSIATRNQPQSRHPGNAWLCSEYVHCILDPWAMDHLTVP